MNWKINLWYWHNSSHNLTNIILDSIHSIISFFFYEFNSTSDRSYLLVWRLKWATVDGAVLKLLRLSVSLGAISVVIGPGWNHVMSTSTPRISLGTFCKSFYLKKTWNFTCIKCPFNMYCLTFFSIAGYYAICDRIFLYKTLLFLNFNQTELSKPK